jgi:transketolase C-terminal domain/subunit
MTRALFVESTCRIEIINIKELRPRDTVIWFARIREADVFMLEEIKRINGVGLLLKKANNNNNKFALLG